MICKGSHSKARSRMTCLFLRASGHRLALCRWCDSLVDTDAHEPCSVGHEMYYRKNAEWFTVELCSEGRTLQFCPAHAMAAEVLIYLGLTGDQVVERLKAYESERTAQREAEATEYG